MTAPVSDFDEGALQMLRRVGSDDLVVRMIDLFTESGPARLDEARAALAAGDAAGVAAAAHALKSSAAQLGGRAVQEAAAELEHDAAIHPGESAARVAALSTAVDALLAHLAAVRAAATTAHRQTTA